MREYQAFSTEHKSLESFQAFSYNIEHQFFSPCGNLHFVQSLFQFSKLAEWFSGSQRELPVLQVCVQFSGIAVKEGKWPSKLSEIKIFSYHSTTITPW